jgi:hypothetical protein
VKSLVGWNGKKYIKREKLLKPSMTTTGYYKYDLRKNCVRKTHRLHHLILDHKATARKNDELIRDWKDIIEEIREFVKERK